jgi:cathepsin D
VAGIAGADIGLDAWIIGGVFLQSVMSVFDATAMTVGFASLA